MKLKLQLYIVSLTLLFTLLFINKVDVCFNDCEFIGWKALWNEELYTTMSGSMIVLGLFLYWIVSNKLTGHGSMPDKIIEIENLNFEHMTFLATYIIPLLTFDLDFHLEERRNGLMFFLVIVVIGFIYVRTNMYYTNPVLAIFGYHIYKLKTEAKGDIIVLTKEKLKKEEYIIHLHISDNVYLARKN